MVSPVQTGRSLVDVSSTIRNHVAESMDVDVPTEPIPNRNGAAHPIPARGRSQSTNRLRPECRRRHPSVVARCSLAHQPHRRHHPRRQHPYCQHHHHSHYRHNYQNQINHNWIFCNSKRHGRYMHSGDS